MIHHTQIQYWLYTSESPSITRITHVCFEITKNLFFILLGSFDDLLSRNRVWKMKSMRKSCRAVHCVHLLLGHCTDLKLPLFLWHCPRSMWQMWGGLLLKLVYMQDRELASRKCSHITLKYVLFVVPQILCLISALLVLLVSREQIGMRRSCDMELSAL